ncbi:TfoX/Sxy family protein [Amycolatopsis tucumanensis]|uniref:TfoX/Sxy family protein n=1 Tax=Amycolatopsis tucumanensis TaxID=401106 RepID=UPI003D74973B
MAYDHELADRVREQLSGVDGVREKRMFGGLAFLVHGNMAVAASSEGGLLVRVDPDEGERLLGEGVQPMVMRGREMRGWLRVDAAVVRTAARLREWVTRGVSYAGALPAKD